MNNTQKIKEIVAKIDIEKITGYLQEHSASKTLRQIIGYKKRALDSSDEKEIFRLSVRLAYNLDMIVNKADYVKKEEEKKH
jgi:GTP-binding protein EngB required for normal cell division